MFRRNLEDIILKGACRAVMSSAEKAIVRCERINWFLYRSDYVLGLRDWTQITPKTKKDILEGLLRYIVLDEGSCPPITDYSTTVDGRRMRLCS